MEWIKTSEKTPPIGKIVLIYCGYGEQDLKFIDGLDSNWFTHWMPLPQHPNEPKITWQYSTRTYPDTWVDATDDEYDIGQHLAKYNWRQIEK